jgi:glycosyltransferase involved in cell wall biosynthesis
MPLVSVLIDTYNHERFIEEAIESVLAQDFPAADREIIVVDDGSTDRTPELLRQFEPQIRILRKQNGGQASAFNVGIRECRGDIVAFLDADDWWAPTKLSQVVAAMNEDPEVGFVGNGIISVFADGTRTTEVLREGFRFQANDLPGALLFRRRSAFLGTSRMTIRRALLQRIGRVPEEIRIQADEYIYTLAAVLMPVRILPAALTYYRLHADNGFIVSNADPAKLRTKQRSLAALADVLSRELMKLGVTGQLRDTILAYTKALADQMRLLLDGGWPWQTCKVEWKMYRVAFPDPALSHRAMKAASLLVALFVPPRRYYAARSKIAQSSTYRRIRERWITPPVMGHIHVNDGRDPAACDGTDRK